MRSILVHGDRGPAMASRLETGLALARMNDGHVTVLVDTQVSRYFAMDPLGGSYVASDALTQAIANDDALGADIAAQLTGQDVPFDIVRSESDPVDALAPAARLADVVIVSRSGMLAGDLAMAARTPVLVLADKGELRFPLNTACIAWDGGNEAALALRGAVPMLAGCGEVQVLTVTEKLGGFPPTDALSYLARHGIKAELHELAKARSVEETLAGEVEQSGAGLLVMGAYGKSRMREYLFGGVTRYFLKESSEPALLLVH